MQNLQQFIPILELYKQSNDSAVSDLSGSLLEVVPNNSPSKDIEDKVIDSTFDELKNDNTDERLGEPISQKTATLWDVLVRKFNKEASAYIEDIKYKDLPKEVKKDVDRFCTCQGDTKLIHYGMVVKELLDKVDIENYNSAKEHIKKVDKDEVYKKLKSGKKYVIIIRDKVVDAHHFIRNCELAGVTSSLDVLDLTPALYQGK